MTNPIERGQPYPLGADPRPDGASFSVYSADATGIELLPADRRMADRHRRRARDDAGAPPNADWCAVAID
jgi:pullulanase/glycogen debranching enzyme